MATLISDIITAAKGRADMLESNYVTPDDWLQFARASYKRLYNILSDAFQDMFTTISPSSTIATDGTVSLPADFKRLDVVDLQDGSDWTNCYPAGGYEARNDFRDRLGIQWRNNQWGITWKLVGSKIYFWPKSMSAGKLIQLWYTPLPVTVDLSTSLPLEMVQWEAFLIADVARMARMKEETDVSDFQTELKDIRADIEGQALNRAMQEVGSVRDVNEQSDDWW